MKIKPLLMVGGALILVPLSVHAAERVDADVSCRATDQNLVYDCAIVLKGKKSGEPIEGAEIAITADMPSMPMAHNIKPAAAMPMGGPGMYHARLHLEMHGEWALKLMVSGPARDIVIKKLHFGDMAQAGHEGHHGSAMAGDKSCVVPVTVSTEAEQQPGGALYEGTPVKHHSGKKHSMPGMEGAHMMHEPQHGGAFFMAPDKIHHLEGTYSDACGFRLYLYNAFTKPIHVDRFQALINVVPSRDDEPDVMRFLSPSEDDTVLKAAIGDEVTPPFRIDLYVKFPEADDPELFTIGVPASAPAVETSADRSFDLNITKGKISGGDGTIRITQGETVSLRWTADQPMMIHLHGYDIERAVQPDAPGHMTFKAHATGRFPVTAHAQKGHSHGEEQSHGGGGEESVLLYLEVYPD